MQIVFLHGLESGPHGGKSQSLTERFGAIESPDCEGVLDVEARLQRVRDLLDTLGGPVVLVGSSFGGLVGYYLAHERPTQVVGLVLLAPALHCVPTSELRHPGAVVRIVHGRHDAVVPAAASQRFVENCGGSLLLVEDGHRLSDSHGAMIAAVEAVLAEAEGARA